MRPQTILAVGVLALSISVHAAPFQPYHEHHLQGRGRTFLQKLGKFFSDVGDAAADAGKAVVKKINGPNHDWVSEHFDIEVDPKAGAVVDETPKESELDLPQVATDNTKTLASFKLLSGLSTQKIVVIAVVLGVATALSISLTLIKFLDPELLGLPAPRTNPASRTSLASNSSGNHSAGTGSTNNTLVEGSGNSTLEDPTIPSFSASYYTDKQMASALQEIHDNPGEASMFLEAAVETPVPHPTDAQLTILEAAVKNITAKIQPVGSFRKRFTFSFDELD